MPETTLSPNAPSTLEAGNGRGAGRIRDALTTGALTPRGTDALVDDAPARGLAREATFQPGVAAPAVVQPARGVAGQAAVNDVVLGATPRDRNAMDAVIDAAVGAGLDALLRGEDATIRDLLDQLAEVTREIEGGRRYGHPELTSERREGVLRDLESAARTYPAPEQTSGAAFLAAGELVANDGSPPPSWDDAVDPAGVERGLRDADGRGTRLLTEDDTVDDPPPAVGQPGFGRPGAGGPAIEIPPSGGGVGLPLPDGGRRIIGYDFQLNINAVRCRFPTESSDELAIEGLCTYEGDNVMVDRYEETGFEAVDPESSTGRFSRFLDAGDYNTEDKSLSTRAHRLLRVRVKYDPRRPTRLTAVFIPTEVELSDLQRMQVTTIFDGLLNAAVGVGLSALGGAAQAVPGVGQILAGVVGSDFVSNAIKQAIRPFVLQLIALFADPDRFTMYGLDLTFMWSDPSRVPLADYTVTGTGTNGFASRPFPARVPRHEIDRRGRVTSFVPTFQTRPLRPGTRRLGPGNYFTQFRSFALKTDFVVPSLS